MVERKYLLPCAPNSDAVEKKVNEIYFQYPKAKITVYQLVSGTYCDRRLEMYCQKCASRVVRTGSMHTCTNCKRPYTQAEFEQNAIEIFTVKGTLYLQPVLVEES